MLASPFVLAWWPDSPLSPTPLAPTCDCSRYNFSKRELGHNVFVVDNLMSAEEARTARSAATRTTYKDPAERMLIGTPLSSGRIYDDEMFTEIEQRIGCLTGIEPHSGEDLLSLTVQRTWPTEAADVGHRLSAQADTIQSLHHDRNRQPERTVTVLIYLSGGEADDADTAAADQLRGGYTAFPCVRPADRAPAAEMDDLCRRLVSGYGRGERMVYSEEPGVVQTSARELCTPVNDALDVGTGRPVAVASTHNGGLLGRPASGSALLFWSASPDGTEAYRNMWHGGCRVMQGEKWTLQKFKFPASSARGSRELPRK